MSTKGIYLHTWWDRRNWL